MNKLLGSVGKGGKNIRDDVELIQELLNRNIAKLPDKKKLKIDCRVGKNTITLIEQYQKIVVKLARPDGRVDPGGKTFKF